MGVVVLLLSAPPTSAAGRVVTFRGEDGRAINALAYEPAQRPAPAVVLVPMLGRPKEDWDAIGQHLADANILAVAIDLPGASDPGAAWSGDVRAAVSYLNSRPEVRSGAIGIAGASLGATLAAMAAATSSVVRSLVLVSPSLDYQGLRIDGPLKQYGGRAALLIASTDDPYAARSVRELAKDAPGIRDARFSSVAAHGTILLARDPDMVGALTEWFQRTLGVN